METRKMVVISIAITLLAFHQVCFGLDLTVEVDAGETECFWQHLKENSRPHLEFQVVDGGDVDIDFTLHAPDGRLLDSEVRTSEETVWINAETEGDYKFCFSNSFSHFASKTVFFELSEDEETLDDDWKFDMVEVQEMVDMTFDDIKGIVDRSKGNLDKSLQLQTLIKMHEARDRNLLEANLSRVNLFSAFQLLVMVTVSLTQVLMIRSLFQEKGARRGGVRQNT